MNPTIALDTWCPTVCIAEDRASCEPALRILVSSLSVHNPNIQAVLYCPNATDSFKNWISSFKNCTLNPVKLEGTWSKYNIKPLALLTTLKNGAGSAIWIDSDILIARNFESLFSGLSNDTIAVTEEALSGTYADPEGLRAKMWGMPIGRSLPFCVNTGIIYVTHEHVALLKTWHELLQSDLYRSAQELPWIERATHLAGDQEVFTALLSSTRFSHFPIKFLLRGNDIIQFFGPLGYTLRERIGHIRNGLPCFVHSQGYRPWWPRQSKPRTWSERFQSYYNQCSPYTTLARAYARALEDDEWLTTDKFHIFAPGPTAKNVWLTGLSFAIIADCVRATRFLSGSLRSSASWMFSGLRAVR